MDGMQDDKIEFQLYNLMVIRIDSGDKFFLFLFRLVKSDTM